LAPREPEVGRNTREMVEKSSLSGEVERSSRLKTLEKDQ
jgi:hypothetical protein